MRNGFLKFSREDQIPPIFSLEEKKAIKPSMNTEKLKLSALVDRMLEAPQKQRAKEDAYGSRRRKSTTGQLQKDHSTTFFLYRGPSLSLSVYAAVRGKKNSFLLSAAEPQSMQRVMAEVVIQRRRLRD